METFFETLLIILGILQPFVWGWLLFSLLVKGAQSVRSIAKPTPTYQIQANNVQINGAR